MIDLPMKLAIHAAVAAALLAGSTSAWAQSAPLPDTREAITLTAPERDHLLAGMRTYLESVQGIVSAMAENDLTRVSSSAEKSGAKLLLDVFPTATLKMPLGFTSMSLDTHDKFDKLAGRAKHSPTRSQVLTDLRDLLANCMSCHAAYRIVVAP